MYEGHAGALLVSGACGAACVKLWLLPAGAQVQGWLLPAGAQVQGWLLPAGAQVQGWRQAEDGTVQAEACAGWRLLRVLPAAAPRLHDVHGARSRPGLWVCQAEPCCMELAQASVLMPPRCTHAQQLAMHMPPTTGVCHQLLCKALRRLRGQQPGVPPHAQVPRMHAALLRDIQQQVAPLLQLQHGALAAGQLPPTHHACSPTQQARVRR